MKYIKHEITEQYYITDERGDIICKSLREWAIDLILDLLNKHSIESQVDNHIDKEVMKGESDKYIYNDLISGKQTEDKTIGTKKMGKRNNS